ncbi:GNAT family N-acetyltransferase [Mycoplasmatota bacterium WC44]
MNKIEIEEFKIRFAVDKDIDLILKFIKSLACYEEMIDEVTATKEDLLETLFNKKYAEVLIGEYNGVPVGFMLFFHNYSTFIGCPGIYLEDFYIEPKWRNNGFGKIMLAFLAELAIERKCKRIEWCCLNWNEPSINFYKSIGAIPMEDWTTFRLDENGINITASSNK